LGFNTPLMLFPTWGQAVYERHANRTASVLEWYDRHRV